MSTMEEGIKNFHKENEKKIKAAFLSEDNQKEIDKWFPNEKDFTPKDWQRVDVIAYHIYQRRMSGHETSQEDLAKEYGLPAGEFKKENVNDILKKEKIDRWSPQAEKYMRDWDKETALEIYKRKKYEWKKEEIEQRKKDAPKNKDEEQPFNAMVPVTETQALTRQGASQGRDLGSRGSRDMIPIERGEAGLPAIRKTGEVPAKREKAGFPAVQKEKIRVNVVNVDEIVKGYAWRLAEEKVRELLHRPEENMQSGGRLKSFWNQISAPFRHPVEFGRKAWVRLAENGYREKFYQEALAEITNDQNLRLEIEASARLNAPIRRTSDPNQRDRHFEILDKIVQEYSNNAAENEEKGRSVNYPPVDSAFKGLISQYYQHVKSNPGESPSDRRSWFEQEQKNMINGLKGQGLLADADFLGDTGRSLDESREGRMYATNMFKVAEDYLAHVDSKLAEMRKENNLTPEQMQAAREHVMSTMDLDINLGAKLSDIHNKKPQGTLGWFEKFVGEKMQNCPILGRLASSPGGAAILAAGATTILGRGILRGTAALGLGAAGVLTGAWIPILSAAAAGGVFGAYRRNAELKWDRGMHQRQTALGKDFDDFRRGRMDEFNYDVVTTGELQRRLSDITQAGSFAELDQGRREQLVDMFARFKFELARDRDYRINKRENRTVDLIAVSGEEGKKFGTNLMSKTDLKIELYDYLKKNNLIGDIHDPLPINNSNNAQFNAMFRDRILELDDNVNGADAAFNSYKARSVMVMGTFGAVAAGTAACAGRWIFENWLGGEKSGGTETALAVAGAGTKLKPGVLNPSFSHGGKSFELFVNNDGQGIDLAKSHIPSGWQPTPDGKGLVFESRGGTIADFREYARQAGHPAEQRVSYGKFAYQGSAPDRGVRALPETLRNLANNRRLHANFTELMMHYKQDANGDVYVDASQMFGKALKGPLKEVGIQMRQALERGEKFYMALAPSNDSSQFHPILLEMGVDGKIKVPKDIAKTFFAFDKSGKLLQGSGKHPGLHQLLYDTGQRRGDGAMRAVGISATLGQEPTLNLPPTHEEIIFVPQGADTPFVVPFSSTPRWQLEGEREKEEGRPDKGNKEPINVKLNNAARIEYADGYPREIDDGDSEEPKVLVSDANPKELTQQERKISPRRTERAQKDIKAGEKVEANQAKAPENEVLAEAEQLLRERKTEQYKSLVQRQALSELNLRQSDDLIRRQGPSANINSRVFSEMYGRALGLNAEATPEQLKSAFRAKIKLLHIDNNANQPQFIQDVRAEQYNILLDLRKDYNENYIANNPRAVRPVRADSRRRAVNA